MDALKKLYTTTTVITVNTKRGMNGITVAWITRVSIKPPMVAISIGKSRYSFELLKETEIFGICILGKNARRIAEHFGSISGRYKNKFENINYKLSSRGIPIVEGTIAYIECKKVSITETGDHFIFVGEVVEQIVYSDEKPLLYGEHKILEV
ncbi:flavin reductase [Thermosipho ferrireducens]|uniref:Flavin reductase n=1 Tax=Thermosipho ferrireducens TaxID=2571116 RepID=A0ABX7S551_9BACT|nr:flavin reductase family protein [Thermosipho ferrireducens]QTA37627.1 flavin reductase [Thermosipho ferrireducens]